MIRRIYELRIDNDIQQKEICDFLNIKQLQYSRYENGKAEPKIEILIKLALFYNTSIDYLLGLTNEKLPYPRSNKSIKK